MSWLYCLLICIVTFSLSPPSAPLASATLINVLINQSSSPTQMLMFISYCPERNKVVMLCLRFHNDFPRWEILRAQSYILQSQWFHVCLHCSVPSYLTPSLLPSLLCEGIHCESTVHSLNSSSDSKEYWYGEMDFYRHWSMQLLNQQINVRQCILHYILRHSVSVETIVLSYGVNNITHSTIAFTVLCCSKQLWNNIQTSHYGCISNGTLFPI
jgi:hypothetical protein